MSVLDSIHEDHLDQVCEANDLGIAWVPTVTGPSVAILGDRWTFTVAGLETREATAAAALYIVRERLTGKCGECLGVRRDLDGDYCGNCVEPDEPSDFHPSDRIVADAAARSMK